MKIEVGKTYANVLGRSVKIVEKLNSPCIGYLEFVGIVENEASHQYVTTFSEDGRNSGEHTSLVEEIGSYLGGNSLEDLEERIGSLTLLKKEYKYVFKEVTSCS